MAAFDGAAPSGAPSSTENALALSWIFGFSREVALHNLCDQNRQAIFYASAHTGIIMMMPSAI